MRNVTGDCNRYFFYYYFHNAYRPSLYAYPILIRQVFFSFGPWAQRNVGNLKRKFFLSLFVFYKFRKFHIFCHHLKALRWNIHTIYRSRLLSDFIVNMHVFDSRHSCLCMLISIHISVFLYTHNMGDTIHSEKFLIKIQNEIWSLLLYLAEKLNSVSFMTHWFLVI